MSGLAVRLYNIPTRGDDWKMLRRAGKPASHVLTTLRAFPTLEPLAPQAVSAQILGLPSRRDILWQAVVYERDSERVGSKTIVGRSDLDYSRRKLLPQKGSGRARMGDRANPIRHDGARAHNKHAPNDHSTRLPSTLYSLAFRTALSLRYREGRLYVIDGAMDFASSHELVGEAWFRKHGLKGKSVTFIVNELRPNLFDATSSNVKADIVPKELVKVQDLLKPQRLLIEKSALEYLVAEYTPPRPLKAIRGSLE